MSSGSGLALALLLLLPSPAASAVSSDGDEDLLVESVDVVNNQFLPRDTLLFYVSTRAGDRYDETRLRADFRRLWGTGFLDDLQLETREGARGKVVIFRVSERKRVQIVDYRGSKELTATAIEDELKKRDLAVRIDTFYDLARARRVERVIEEMLAAKGRPFGKARHDAKAVGGAGLQLSFVIDDGPKARVKEIVFEGSEVFSDGDLRGHMKKIKPAGFWNFSWVGGRTTFTEERWAGGADDPRGDQGRLEDFYLDHGYVQARVGQPRLTYADGRSGLFSKKPVKWIRLEIPVTEGDQYRLGEVRFEGLTVFKEDFVRPLFKLKAGDVYDDSRFKKGLDKLRDLYGTVGHFQWTGGTRRKPDPDRKVVDVTLTMEEDKRYYVGRIHFAGNDNTRDKVIRREIYMNEGDVLNTEALKLSIKRINQLGYFKPMEGAPDLQPSPRHDDMIDVTFKVQEQNRNQFTFGGGVSGLEGTFLNASFQTANFLGSGDTVTLTAQTGSRTRNYQLAVTKPYFLDRPMTAGFDIFLRRLTYLNVVNFVGYSQQDQGVAVTSGLPVGRFSRLFASYSYEIIDIYGVASVAGQSLPPGFLAQVGRRYESRVSPSWVRDTTDNPFTPRRGTKNTATFQFVGGPLGGTVSYYRPSLESILYVPVGRRTALGLRGDIGYIRPFGITTTIPYYQRYFLGGENQIRGYDVRTVAPLDPTTKTAVGGNKYVLFNAEYYFDIFGPLRFLLFFDAGEAYRENETFNLRTLRTSTGAEIRFLMPVLNVPFRLIYAWNANRDSFQPKTAFKFAVGTTF
jgi:outer membrane protein insertion porin family